MTAPSTPVTPAALLTIDALGRKCPIPIIMLAEQIRDVPVGSIIAVRADDPAAYADVPSWCGMKSHEFVYRDALESGWEFGIRRQYLSRTMPRDSPASRGSCVCPQWRLWVDSLPPKGAIGWNPNEGDVTVTRPGAGVDGS